MGNSGKRAHELGKVCLQQRFSSQKSIGSSWVFYILVLVCWALRTLTFIFRQLHFNLAFQFKLIWGFCWTLLDFPADRPDNNNAYCAKQLTFFSCCGALDVRWLMWQQSIRARTPTESLQWIFLLIVFLCWSFCQFGLSRWP